MYLTIWSDFTANTNSPGGGEDTGHMLKEKNAVDIAGGNQWQNNILSQKKDIGLELFRGKNNTDDFVTTSSSC